MATGEGSDGSNKTIGDTDNNSHQSGSDKKAGAAALADATGASPAITSPTVPPEAAISLRTVGKTVAFLTKLAAPGGGGRGDIEPGMGDIGLGVVPGGGAYR